MVGETNYKATVKGGHKIDQTTHTKYQEATQNSTQENNFLRQIHNCKVHSNHILTQDTGNYI